MARLGAILTLVAPQTDLMTESFCLEPKKFPISSLPVLCLVLLDLNNPNPHVKTDPMNCRSLRLSMLEQLRKSNLGKRIACSGQNISNEPCHSKGPSAEMKLQSFGDGKFMRLFHIQGIILLCLLALSVQPPRGACCAGWRSLWAVQLVH